MLATGADKSRSGSLKRGFLLGGAELEPKPVTGTSSKSGNAEPEPKPDDDESSKSKSAKPEPMDVDDDKIPADEDNERDLSPAECIEMFAGCADNFVVFTKAPAAKSRTAQDLRRRRMDFQFNQNSNVGHGI